jgi:pimeloyl-ACP methyl ester carboxylesterase
MNVRASIARVVALIMTLAACTASHLVPKEFQPSFRTAECPADVEVQLLEPHECGYLTVLQDRADPTGRRIEVFVLRIDPTQPHPSADPLLVAGWDVGDVTPYGSAQGLATGVHRVVYFLDARGVGHSRPSLACPELPEATAGLGSSDPIFARTFLRAVRSCKVRLTDEGVDLGSYDVQESAGDIEDLRRVLGIKSWNIASYGTDSRIVLEALRSSTAHVRAVYLDAAQFPELTDPDVATAGTERAIEEIFSSCADDPPCRRTYPHLRGDWATALRRFGRDPVRAFFVPPGTEKPIAVEVDAATLVRAIRSEFVAAEAGHIAAIPSMIHAAAGGRLTVELASVVAEDPTLCNGYRPNCAVAAGFSIGEYLSILCRDEAPFANASSTSDPASRSGSSAIDDAFVANPYLEACSVWDVPPAEAPVPTRIDIPALVLSGQFDPFSPPLLTSRFAASLPAFFIAVPAQAGSVIAHSGCPNDIAHTWLDSPTASPRDTSCLGDMHERFTDQPQPLAPIDYPG